MCLVRDKWDWSVSLLSRFMLSSFLRGSGTNPAKSKVVSFETTDESHLRGLHQLFRFAWASRRLVHSFDCVSVSTAGTQACI